MLNKFNFFFLVFCFLFLESFWGFLGFGFFFYALGFGFLVWGVFRFLCFLKFFGGFALGFLILVF